MKQSKTFYSLVPLDDFKAIFGIDDREDALSTFCLETASRAIERYCVRRLFLSRHFEQIEFTGELLLPLREYPVGRILAAYAIRWEELVVKRDGELLEPEFYSVIPECGSDDEWPYSLSLSPLVKRCYPGLAAIKVVYSAGYASGMVPVDLAAACMELAVWNMSRYKGRRVGMTGSVRGQGKDGEHFELSMPESVKTLLEPYRRRLI